MASQEKLTNAHTLRQTSVRRKTFSFLTVRKKSAHSVFSIVVKDVPMTMKRQLRSVLKLLQQRICQLWLITSSLEKYAVLTLLAMHLKYMRILAPPCFLKSPVSLDPKPQARLASARLYVSVQTWICWITTSSSKNQILAMLTMRQKLWLSLSVSQERLLLAYCLRISLRASSRQNSS